MSATHPYECDISLAFPEAVDAAYALETLRVDAELQPDKITRTLAVEGTNLVVHFEATEIRLLRAAVSSFYDMGLLVARTLLEFKE
uniref:Transcription factor Pcc1 n=1 Tax=Globisporangium ultimum (strain ATCC 200006 / CBS 805.95 / DAOM BR144) TaxID=431595 RepID=K3WQ75_GLOUD